MEMASTEESGFPSRSLPQMFPQASGFGITGSQFINVSGDVNYHPPTMPEALQVGNTNRHEERYSDCESYSAQLTTRGRGYPLYVPQPRGNLPTEYQRHGVAIGDVGRITDDGIFDFFFNIYLPADHPINAVGTPDNYHPLTPYYDSADVTPFDYSSDHVSTPWSIRKLDQQLAAKCVDRLTELFGVLNHSSASRDFVFDCDGPQGALVVNPFGSHVQKLDNLEAMLRYTRQNAEAWYRYVNGPRGRRLPNGSLYLVTGWEKTRAWGIATFQDLATQSPFRISFTGANSMAEYRWSASGPARTKNSMTLPPSDEPLNQTIFIHGFSIAL
ncbi:hypothetical protein FB45DRAFT_1110990, partial [Roridomyces roridus]